MLGMLQCIGGFVENVCNDEQPLQFSTGYCRRLTIAIADNCVGRPWNIVIDN